MTGVGELAVARPSRRTVARALAWTIPVVTVATAAPAYALTGCSTWASSFRVGGGSADPDVITVTNQGPVTLPVGTVITWTIRNVGTSTSTYTVSLPAGSPLTLTSGGTSQTIAVNATATWTFTVGTAIASGGTFALRDFGTGDWHYASTISFTPPGCFQEKICRGYNNGATTTCA